MWSYQLTVNKGIFELWAAPDTTLVLLGVLVSLPVAILAEGRPEVERVDAIPRSALVADLLLLMVVLWVRMPWRLQPVKAVKGLRWHDGRGDIRMHRWRQGHRTLVAGDDAVKGVMGLLCVPRRLPQGKPAAVWVVAPSRIVFRSGGESLRGQDGPRWMVERRHDGWELQLASRAEEECQQPGHLLAKSKHSSQCSQCPDSLRGEPERECLWTSPTNVQS